MNPLFNSGNSSANQATAPSNVANQSTPVVRRSFNRFNNSYAHYTSALYGEYVPFYVQEVNPTDSKKFKSKIQVRTDTLISPLYSNVKMNKDYFFVPYDALLPFNWDKIYKNPSQGDDVPSDASFTLDNFYVSFLPALLNRVQVAISGFNDLSSFGKAFFVLALPLLDDFFSTSGSFSRMRCPLSHLVSFYFLPAGVPSTGKEGHFSWDRFTELLYPSLFKDGLSFELYLTPDDATPIYVEIDSSSTDDFMPISITSNQRHAKVTPKTFISLLRYYPQCFVSESALQSFDGLSLDLSPYVLSQFHTKSKFASSSPQDSALNYSRFAAYSMCCAQFYSNGQVDSVFSAQLYRDMLSSYVNDCYISVDSTPVTTFLYNGVKTPYDWLSSHYFQKCTLKMLSGFALGASSDSFSDFSAPLSALMYCRAIFDLHNCIKYGDYFTGAHTRPLAVGDVTAPVVGSSVSAIDMTKALLYQKFLNVVVKLKNDISDYLKTIFGTLPAPDYHEAKFVSHSEGQVSGFDVANTAENQGNLCSLLHDVNENFEFDLQCNQSGVCLGVLSFVSSRAYCMTSDRQCHYVDRYDMYNPMLQGLGDQSILSVEKSGLHSVPFAYQSRYGELKQRTNYASGAFVDKLRSYCIISDSPFIDSNCLEVLSPNLSPVYIRLIPTEFNRFVKQSGSWSYGNDYHFIVEVNNDVDDVLEMEYSPNVL